MIDSIYLAPSYKLLVRANGTICGQMKSKDQKRDLDYFLEKKLMRNQRRFDGLISYLKHITNCFEFLNRKN